MDILSTTKIRPTKVYDAYWRFASERMAIYYRRLQGKESPWTEDQILETHKFTNSYRALDRVSQYLIREIILPDEKNNLTSEDKLFRILLFKIFNRVETWEALSSSVGDITWSQFSYSRYSKVLSSLMADNQRIYSAAYIMASGKSYFGYTRKHENHLALLEHMFNNEFPNKVEECASMGQLYELLLSYPTIGSFLAYQFATDINYSSNTNFSEMEFVKAGPGALDGISKCFSTISNHSPEYIIKYVTDRQEYEFNRLGINFPGLFGRPLQLIDCQNLFCEISKYSRVAFPEITGCTNRTKIKQQYKNPKQIDKPAFPKKWNLDIQKELSA